MQLSNLVIRALRIIPHIDFCQLVRLTVGESEEPHIIPGPDWVFLYLIGMLDIEISDLVATILPNR